mmetsp:Transcript_34855/g.89495  ORF Transcript_34855/g.89495 Transcript_34855/m.89495 type:complete len:272 (-) Transcript_34855:1756-2571(-)
MAYGFICVAARLFASMGKPRAPRNISSSYSVRHACAASSAASTHSRKCSHADCIEINERREPPAHSNMCLTTSALSAKSASCESPASSAAVAPVPLAPKQRASSAVRGTLKGNSLPRRWRRRWRDAASSLASFEQKSSCSATLIFPATCSKSRSTAWNWSPSLPASSAQRAPRRSALAPYLERAPLRKAAWLAESLVHNTSISVSWFRSSFAPWRQCKAALCCARRDCGPARARCIPLPAPAAARCSSRRFSRAVVQQASCSRADRAPSAP